MTGIANPEILVDTSWVADHLHDGKVVDTSWVADHLHDGKVRVVECDGSPAAYDSGHIEGAVFWNAYRDILRPDVRVNDDALAAADLFSRSGIGNDTSVVLYSASHSAAALGLWYLKLFGHRDARFMNGGRKKWTAEGRTLTTAAAAVRAAQYVPGAMDESSRALRAQVEQAIGRADAALVDTQRLQEYSGEWFSSKPPEGAERAGHMPGARHILYENAVNVDGTFKSADELRALYGEQGVTPDKEVITYCTLGWRAAHTWLVLKYLLGYPNVRNYDASWNEWGRRPDTAIET